MALSPELLEVPVKDWVDRGNAERFAAVYDSPRPLTVAQQLDFDGVELARIPGVIAEEVAAAAGGEAFITRGADGEIEGVSYDRFALARTQVLAQQVATTNERLDDALAQITELRDLLGAR
ncbi:hypothetical protein [Lacisediminihabitans profunda]|nr:hypothetical protein [Lacisediminihabitans profunda]